MATDKPRKTEVLTPPRDGEFWRINGIAEATENRLHTAGIHTFRQLAALTPAEIASVLPGQVGAKERAARQDWAGQAREFAETLEQVSPEPETPLVTEPTVVEEPAERQHYESFIVELLLDEERSVRRTRITNVRCGQKDGWAGWDPARLGEWIAGQIDLDLEAPRSVAAEQKPSLGGIGGKLALPEAKLFAHGTDKCRRFSYPGQALDLGQSIDLTEVIIPPGVQAAYQATVEAKRIGSGEQVVLGQAQGEFDGEPKPCLRISLQPMLPGTYRLATTVMIYPTGSVQPQREGILAFQDGGLVHVFDR